MFTERELRTVLGNWDTGKNPTITDIYVNDGSKKSGSVWAVGSDYILKAGDRDALMKNIRIAKALHRQGFYSSLPVMTKDGKEILDGPGGQAFILIRSLKGTPLPRSEKFGDDRARYAGKYGISIARLHKALKSIQKDISPDEVDLYRNVSDWALPNVRQQNIQWSMGISDEFFSDYASGFGKLYDKLPKQLIHRDPNPGNILFDDGEVTGFIDFDLSECNIRLWDVCYCATGILAEDSNEAYEKRNMHPDKRLSEKMEELCTLTDKKGVTGMITYLGVYASGGSQSNWIRNEVCTDDLLALIENRTAEKVLNCIGSNDRLNILLALLKKPMTVAEIVSECGLNSTGQAYHHMKPLLAADLIIEDANSKGVYVVQPHKVQGIIMLLAGICDMVDETYSKGTWDSNE